MECKIYEKLEQDFIVIRNRRADLFRKGQLTPEIMDELERQECEARTRLKEHGEEHQCSD